MGSATSTNCIRMRITMTSSCMLSNCSSFTGTIFARSPLAHRDRPRRNTRSRDVDRTYRPTPNAWIRNRTVQPRHFTQLARLGPCLAAIRPVLSPGVPSFCPSMYDLPGECWIPVPLPPARRREPFVLTTN